MHLKCIKHEENQNVIRNSRIFARDYFRCPFINSERLIKESDERVLIGHPPST